MPATLNQGGATFNTSLGIAESTGDGNSYYSYNPLRRPTPLPRLIPASRGGGFNGVALDLFGELAANSATYQGTFTVDSSGDVNFSASPPGAAPEPGRIVLLGLGLAGLVYRRRRPSKLAA